MSSLAKKITAIVQGAFEAESLPAELGLVRVSDRPDLAQFQCNGAMAAAKIAKKAPRQIAQTIIEQLNKHKIFDALDIAGPGFININVTPKALEEHLAQIAQDDRLGVPQSSAQETILLDYGGMNIAKAMHVGHMRPTVIGDALKKIIRHAGYDALGDIHMGDWGMPIGQIISEFEIRHPEWVYFDPDFSGPYPDEPPFSYGDLEKIYPEASAACKAQENRREQARKATAELQQGRPGYRAMLQQFLRLSIKDIKQNLAPFGVEFEIWKGESDVNDLIPEITQDLEDKGLLENSEGAKVIRVARDDDNQDIPPLMFLKSDGAQTYGTSDLATIYDRVRTHPDLKKIIYVTDTRQSLHFEQVFRAAKKANYAHNIELVHIGNGTINGTDGKPFKTRDGGVMKFATMIETAVNKARQRLAEAELAQDFDEKEREVIAQKVAVAALKFNELSNQPHMDYVFDLDRMTAFEGKTGPYLLYQAVRIRSLLNKAETKASSQSFSLQDEDKDLALTLAQWPDHFAQALQHYSPHYICEYAYNLAQAFSRFYAQCHILSEENEDLKLSRLALCDLTLQHLQTALSLLGIAIPERM